MTTPHTVPPEPGHNVMPMPAGRQASDGEDADERLRTALKATWSAPADDSAQRLEQRVLADWRWQMTSVARARSAPPARGWAAVPAWVGAAGLVAGVCLAYSLWLTQGSDPLLDDLAQIDVLSQMAAGEM